MRLCLSNELTNLSRLTSEAIECTYLDEELQHSCILVANKMNNIAVDMYEWEEYEIAKDLFTKSLQAFFSTAESTGNYHSYNISREIEIIEEKQRSQIKVFDIGLYSLPNSKYNKSLLPEPLRLSRNVRSFSSPQNYKAECCCVVLFNMCLLCLKQKLIKEAKDVLNKISTFTDDPVLNFVITSALGCLYHNENDSENALNFFLKARSKGMSLIQNYTDTDIVQLNRQLGIVFSNIGRVYFIKGQYKEATKECLQLLRTMRSSFGYDNKYICVALYNLGLIHQAQGKIDEAMEFFYCFRDHPSVSLNGDLSTYDMVTTLLNILQIDFGLESTEFNQILRKVQKLRDELGYEHMLVPNLLNDVGQILLQNSLPNFALPFFFEELRIVQHLYGFHCSSSASTLYYIGKTYQEQNEHAEASFFLEKSLELLKKTNTKGKIYGFVTYEIALINCSNGKYLTAMKQFVNALYELRQALGEYNLDIADILQNIGVTMLDLGKFDEGFNNFLEALMIYRMVYGNNHFKVAEILYQIGNLLQCKGENEEALNSFSQSLRIQKISIPKKAIFIVRTLNEIAELNLKRGEINKSILAFEEILNILRERLGENHTSIVYLSNLIGSLYVENGMTRDGITYYRASQVALQKMKHSDQEPNDQDFEIEIISLFGNYFPPPAARAA